MRNLDERQIKGIDIIVLELTKFNDISAQKRYDVLHCLRPIPHEWIVNYENGLQKEIDEYVKYQNFDARFEEIYCWQQDIIYSSLLWNYSLRKLDKE